MIFLFMILQSVFSQTLDIPEATQPQNFSDNWVVILSTSKIKNSISAELQQHIQKEKLQDKVVRLNSSMYQNFMPCFEIVVYDEILNKKQALALSKEWKAKGIDNYVKNAGKYVGYDQRFEQLCQERNYTSSKTPYKIGFAADGKIHVPIEVSSISIDRIKPNERDYELLPMTNEIWRHRLNSRTIEDYTIGDTFYAVKLAYGATSQTCTIESFSFFIRGTPNNSPDLAVEWDVDPKDYIDYELPPDVDPYELDMSNNKAYQKALEKARLSRRCGSSKLFATLDCSSDITEQKYLISPEKINTSQILYAHQESTNLNEWTKSFTSKDLIKEQTRLSSETTEKIQITQTQQLLFSLDTEKKGAILHQTFYTGNASYCSGDMIENYYSISFDSTKIPKFNHNEDGTFIGVIVRDGKEPLEIKEMFGGGLIIKDKQEVLFELTRGYCSCGC